MALDSRQYMFCWTPGTDRAGLVPWPDPMDLAGRYGLRYTTLACNADFQRANFNGRKCQILCEALHAIVRDRVPAEAVHRALLPLAEYQDAMADDMPGMAEIIREASS